MRFSRSVRLVGEWSARRAPSCAGPSSRGCLSPGARPQSHAWSGPSHSVKRLRLAAKSDVTTRWLEMITGIHSGSLRHSDVTASNRHTFHSRARGAAFGRWPSSELNPCQFFKQRDPAHILSLRLSHPFRTKPSGVHAESRRSVRCYPYRFCTCVLRSGLASKISIADGNSALQEMFCCRVRALCQCTGP